MSSNKIYRLAYSNLKGILAVFLYKRFGIDFYYPTLINAQLTTACNSCCSMCDVWRERENDIPAIYWISALKQYKDLVGTIKVSFAGGEVLLKDDVFEIFKGCNRENILWGITTNGFLLTKENIRKLISFHPYDINISLDSLKSDVYEKIRGVPFLEAVKSNINYLMKYIKENELDVKVSIKTVVNNLNLTELEDLARYATAQNITGITFDPLKRKRKIFIDKKIPEFELLAIINREKLQQAKTGLITLKRQGFRILNSEKNINQWFMDEQFSKDFFCSVPLRYLIITSEGYVKLCDYSDVNVGNIKDGKMKAILQNSKTRGQKKVLASCKTPCVFCINRNLEEYFEIFRSHLKK